MRRGGAGSIERAVQLVVEPDLDDAIRSAGNVVELHRHGRPDGEVIRRSVVDQGGVGIGGGQAATGGAGCRGRRWWNCR